LKYNKTIISVSLALDFLIIGLMSLPNDLVFVQFQSLAYLIKVSDTDVLAKSSSHLIQLDIEMAASRLIVKVATSTGIRMIDASSLSTPPTTSSYNKTGPIEFAVPTQIITKDDGEYHGTFWVPSKTVLF
jgi:hypothetical protein